MSVSYDVCKVFNHFHAFYALLGASESHFFMTCARFSMVPIDFLVIASGVYIYTV